MRRLPILDGLRGLAALMIFVDHVQLPGLYPATLGLDGGVLIFFSLSGYLLYSPFVTAIRDGHSVDIFSYSVRRVLRIAPAYLVASFGSAWLWYPKFLHDPVGIASTMWTPILVVWTLQLEVAFYLLLPLIASVVGRAESVGRVRILLWTAIASLAITVVAMVASLQLVGFVPGQAVASIASYLWAFVPGMIVAELEHRGVFQNPLPLVVFAAGCALVAISIAFDLPSFIDLPAALGASVLIAFVISRPRAASRFDRLFVVGGALSYSVYLWHVPIIDAFDRPDPSWVGAFVSAIVTVAVASLVYLAIERPAILLSHRLRPHARRPLYLDPVLPR